MTVRVQERGTCLRILCNTPHMRIRVRGVFLVKYVILKMLFLANVKCLKTCYCWKIVIFRNGHLWNNIFEKNIFDTQRSFVKKLFWEKVHFGKTVSFEKRPAFGKQTHLNKSMFSSDEHTDFFQNSEFPKKHVLWKYLFFTKKSFLEKCISQNMNF